MKFGIYATVICLFISGLTWPSHPQLLQDVLRPSVIDVMGNHLYVMDIERMHIFSLDPLKHLKTFGKKGEGPGEYPVFSSASNTIRAYPKYVLHEALSKVLFFDPNGKFLRETKKPALVKNVRPLGTKFIGRRIYQPRDGATAYSVIGIYDREMKLEKELARQKFFQQGSGAALTFNLSYDFLLFDVSGDRIFIERSQEGAFVDVFDRSGTKLYRFAMPIKRIPIRETDKKILLNFFIQDSRIQQIMKQNHIGWKELSKNFRFKYPEYFPAVCDMTIDNNQIYIRTWLHDRLGRSEYLVLDLRGKLLKRFFLPPLIPFRTRSIGSGKRKAIHQGKVYYITENEDGDWYLNYQEIPE